MEASTLKVPAVPASVRVARQAVRDVIDGTPAADAAALMVSELVTTALVEGGLKASDVIEIHTLLTGHRLRVTVCDPQAWHASAGHGAIELHRHGHPGSGLGLKIVARLADRWGMTSELPGTRAWFEVDTGGS